LGTSYGKSTRGDIRRREELLEELDEARAELDTLKIEQTDSSDQD
jgi:hypothetical protein